MLLGILATTLTSAITAVTLPVTHCPDAAAALSGLNGMLDLRGHAE